MTKHEVSVKINRCCKIYAVILLVVFVSTTAYAFLGGVKWTGKLEASVEKIEWEYRVVSLSSDMRIEDGSFETDLNKLGKEGWELEALVTTQAGGYYVMKRPHA